MFKVITGGHINYTYNTLDEVKTTWGNYIVHRMCKELKRVPSLKSVTVTYDDGSSIIVERIKANA